MSQTKSDINFSSPNPLGGLLHIKWYHFLTDLESAIHTPYGLT